MEMNSNPSASPKSRFIRRLGQGLFTWRNSRRALVAVGVLATLLAIVYAAENWRGRRAWAKAKSDLAAKGEELDWAAYIPAPVPDDRNVFKAPHISDWFVRSNLSAAVQGNIGGNSNRSAITAGDEVLEDRTARVIATLTVVQTNLGKLNQHADAILQFDGSAPAAQTVREHLAGLMQKVTSPLTNPPENKIWRGASNMQFIEGPQPEIYPALVWVQSAQTIDTNTIASFVPKQAVPSDLGHVKLKWKGNDSLQVLLLPKVYSAKDYLAWSDRYQTNFSAIREALKRPDLHIEGDYQFPFASPFPNFVSLRNAAQTLAQRAQCHLLTGESAKALEDVTLIHDMCRLLRGKPSLLVSAMIEVAIVGLYAETISNGLRLHQWQEPQLVALQKQLAEIDLPPSMVGALRAERAAACRFVEVSTYDDVRRLAWTEQKKSPWQKITDPTYWFVTFAPRGWVYQNIASMATLSQGSIETFDPKTNLITPQHQETVTREIDARLKGFSPYMILAKLATPNITKAWRVVARNQTLANQTLLACALERYRMAHGQYPEKLEMLTPQLVEKIPAEIIGGHSLKYHRTDDGKFVLYSIGWNEKDDGGVQPKAPNDLTEGDWVWQAAAN